MRSRIILLSVLTVVKMNAVQAQNPPLYVNLVTHNEMEGEYYDSIESEYSSAKAISLQILNKVNSIGAKWNFQCCSKIVLGCLKWDNAASVSNDLLETLQASGRVEIDPRSKTLPPQYMYNISDVYHLLDSCGVSSTTTVGGFLCYPYNQQDWTKYRNPIFGAVYGKPWQAEIIWGGGSPGHVQDANNYGVWKPKGGDSYTNFYTHDPAANLWLVGNGCSPQISDTTMDVQWIVNLIRDNIQKIQDGTWPANTYYSLSVMTDVKNFDSPNYVARVSQVLDSIQHFVNAGQAQWAHISEKLTLFQQWSSTSGQDHVMWSCEEGTAGTTEVQSEGAFKLFPNPVTDVLHMTGLKEQVNWKLSDCLGSELLSGTGFNKENLTLSFDNYPAGIYFVSLNNQVYQVIKE